MDLKRKHVVFDESAATGEGEERGPAGPSIHPDRAGVHAPKAKKAKTVSARQKRYNAARQRRQRKMKTAKKAAAPKAGGWEGEGESGGEGERESGGEEGEGEEREGEGEEREGEGEEREGEGEEREDETEAVVHTVSAAGDQDERAVRRAEKTAKRDERRAERKARRAAERAARMEAKREAASDSDEDEGENGAEGDGDETQVDGHLASGESDSEADLPLPDLPARLSPPPLEPFPLPRPAPAPDAAILSRQGLPSGLSDATLIDQSLREPLSGLSERTTQRLAELGVEDLFAVQAALLPHLLALPLVPRPHAGLRDFLISAPTGSGKTLAYALPIVEVLARRIVPRLRALVVLPTRDLVVQVRETLDSLAKGTGLLIGSVAGQHSFAHEQSVVDGLDILVATPGRLMDHLAAGLTLQHLRFLVIDEADRLLTQSFQNWLAQVLAHTRPPAQPAAVHDAVASSGDAGAVAASWLPTPEFEGAAPATSTCQKLLFSATLTRDPAQVAALDLSSPRYLIVQSGNSSSYALPPGLEEKVVILPPALKPLNLIHLLHGFSGPALVFTKSVEGASRLVRLLEFFEDAYVGHKLTVRGYSRDMAPSERRQILNEFGNGVDVVVCSDLVARGIDLPAVEHVVSYDVPLDMTKYVHRAGRTARAGRAGTVWTLVEKQEALHFKRMLREAAHEGQVKKIKVKEDELAGYRESYDIAMARLREEYGRD